LGSLSLYKLRLHDMTYFKVWSWRSQLMDVCGTTVRYSSSRCCICLLCVPRNLSHSLCARRLLLM